MSLKEVQEMYKMTRTDKNKIENWLGRNKKLLERGIFGKENVKRK